MEAVMWYIAYVVCVAGSIGEMQWEYPVII